MRERERLLAENDALRVILLGILNAIHGQDAFERTLQAAEAAILWLKTHPPDGSDGRGSEVSEGRP